MAEQYEVPRWVGMGITTGNEVNWRSAMIEHLQSSAPEYVFREASLEARLLGSFAIGLGPQVARIEAVPTAIAEQVGRFDSVARDPGRRAYGLAGFRVVPNPESNDVTISQGTVLYYYRETTGETVAYQTTEDLVIVPEDSEYGTVGIECLDRGTVGNGALAGEVLRMHEGTQYVTLVTVAETTHGGKDVEGDASLMDRVAAARLARTDAIVTPDNFVAKVYQRNEVGRVLPLQNYDPAYPGETRVGHFTLVLADDDGQALQPNEVTALQQWLESQMVASIILHIIPPTPVDVTLTVTVKVSDEVARAGVEQALRDYLSPKAWEFGRNQFDEYDVARVVWAVPGVTDIVSVVPETVDLGTTPGVYPNLVSLTVNVEA